MITHCTHHAHDIIHENTCVYHWSIGTIACSPVVYIVYQKEEFACSHGNGSATRVGTLLACAIRRDVSFTRRQVALFKAPWRVHVIAYHRRRPAAQVPVTSLVRHLNARNFLRRLATSANSSPVGDCSDRQPTSIINHQPHNNQLLMNSIRRVQSSIAQHLMQASTKRCLYALSLTPVLLFIHSLHSFLL